MFRFLWWDSGSQQTNGVDDASSSPGAKDVLSTITAYGIDTATKYGLDTSFNFVQAVCAVVGIVGVGTVAKRTLGSKRLDVAPLYNRLRQEGGPLAWPHLRVRFSVSPYSLLSKDKAVILQGRPKEGKTTLLRTSIPWYHRWNVWPVSYLTLWWGIYLDGSEARASITFDRWLTVQMLGTVPQARTEIKEALYSYRRRQWFRLLMEKLRMPFWLPRPMYVIVDQFEEVIRRFPSEALPWADTLTQAHTRNNLARVIFVVNSDAGAETLLQLSWLGNRFNRLVLNPSKSDELWKLSQIDRDLFSQCQNNVGLYKIVEAGLADGSLKRESMSRFVKMKLLLWDRTFCLPFPYVIHKDWLFVFTEEGMAAVKRKLAQSVSALLYVPERTPNQNYKHTRRVMDAVVQALALMDSTHFLATSQAEWKSILTNEGLMKAGLTRVEATMVAFHLKYVLSRPVIKDVPKPVWQI